MTNLNVIFVVLVIQVASEPEGLEVLEYLVFVVLNLQYFICFDYTMLHYIIFHSVILVQLKSVFILSPYPLFYS